MGKYLSDESCLKQGDPLFISPFLFNFALAYAINKVQKKVVGLERGSLRLVSTTEELLNRKVAARI
jgi:hypothetical protein